MSKMVEVWVVRGYMGLPGNGEVTRVYERAFGTKDDAEQMKQRGETKLPDIYWTMDRMNFGSSEYADYEFDTLVKELGGWK
jgi:hypothetical protein